MRAEQDFWRLLTDYERLTQNESAALGAKDFDELAAIHSCKDVLLSKLTTTASEAGLDRRSAELSRRIDLLIASEERNLQLVGEMVARTVLERQSLDAARLRLRELGSIYLPEKTERPSFSAFV